MKAERIQLIEKDSIAIMSSKLGLKPELKLLYPRITPTKGYFSFQLGDYEYFKYVKNINLNEIEYIKLISADGSECWSKPQHFVGREPPDRHHMTAMDLDLDDFSRI